MTNNINSRPDKLHAATVATFKSWYTAIAIAAIAGAAVFAATYWPTPVSPLTETSPVANGAAEPVATAIPRGTIAPTAPRLAPPTTTTP